MNFDHGDATREPGDAGCHRADAGLRPRRHAATTSGRSGRSPCAPFSRSSNVDPIDASSSMLPDSLPAPLSRASRTPDLSDSGRIRTWQTAVRSRSWVPERLSATGRSTTLANTSAHTTQPDYGCDAAGRTGGPDLEDSIGRRRLLFGILGAGRPLRRELRATVGDGATPDRAPHAQLRRRRDLGVLSRAGDRGSNRRRPAWGGDGRRPRRLRSVGVTPAAARSERCLRGFRSGSLLNRHHYRHAMRTAANDVDTAFCEAEVLLLRVDPALGSHQLDGYVREGHSHRRAIRRTAMVRRKKEWAGLLVALPARANELRLLLSATMVDEFLDPVVVPDVQVPGIARRVAALRRVFHRHQLRRALS